jgi:hypothetical protein
MKWIKVIAILLCPIVFLGCATIVSGRTQRVSVSTFPADAKVTINGMEQKSPCVVMLDRSVPSYQIIIEKEGYQPYVYNLNRGINGWVFGNIILGGIIGIVIDCASGSVYAFSPDNISVNLSKIVK